MLGARVLPTAPDYQNVPRSRQEDYEIAWQEILQADNGIGEVRMIMRTLLACLCAAFVAVWSHSEQPLHHQSRIWSAAPANFILTHRSADGEANAAWEFHPANHFASGLWRSAQPIVETTSTASRAEAINRNLGECHCQPTAMRVPSHCHGTLAIKCCHSPPLPL